MAKRNPITKPDERATVADGGHLLTVEETAVFLHLSVSVLNKWRVAGSGPRFIRLNGRVRYRPGDIAAFLENKSRMSTSEAPAA